jgi:hypothetical protein
MRFFEFAGDDGVDKFVMVLRNYIGRAASKKAPAKLNWNGLQQILRSNGFEVSADYETFKAMYDASPAIQNLVKNFNDKGIELNVPGAPNEEPKGDGTKGPEDSQAAVDQTAASAAAGQLAKSQATPQI